MRRLASGLKWLMMALCIGCPFVAHFVLVDHAAAGYRLVLLFLPLALFAGWAILQTSRKLLWSVLALAAAVLIYAIDQHNQAGMILTYGLPHAAAYLFLLWLFGHTLRNGSVPLITRLARRLHGPLTPRMEAYTRGVTAAWCVFCVLQLAMSAVLLAFAPLETWSLFVNILNGPLVALMFVGEYGYRILRFPEHPRTSIRSMIREFAKDAQATTNTQAH